MSQQLETSQSKPPFLYILGARVDDVSVAKALEKIEKELVKEKELVQVSNLNQQFYITTPNPEICLYATRDEHYRRDILDKAFLALPDGFGLKIAAWIFGERLKNRVTGVDFTCALMKRAAKRGWRVFLFGGEEGVAKRCGEVLMEKYKGLNIVGMMGGKIFNFQFSIFNKFSNNQFLKSKQQGISPRYEGGDQGEVIESINQTKPDILLVALGAPRQEYWIAENLSKLPSVRLAAGVGGTFDFIAGKVQRAPKILRRAGLEWLWRLIVQPWRARRIYNATLKFIFTVLQWRVRMTFVYRRNVVGLILRGGEDFKSSKDLKSFLPRGCSSVVECLLPKQKIAGSIPVTRSNLKILLVERSDEPGHWQFSQGGIDKGETPHQAIIREIKEEIGIDKIKIIKQSPNFYRYEWPKVDKLRRGYRGQKQDLFILEFTGADDDIHIDNREHSNYQWVPIEKIEETVHEVRREQTRKAIAIYHDYSTIERDPKSP